MPSPPEIGRLTDPNIQYLSPSPLISILLGKIHILACILHSTLYHLLNALLVASLFVFRINSTVLRWVNASGLSTK